MKADTHAWTAHNGPSNETPQRRLPPPRHSGLQRGGGEPRQGGEPQLPYPWERLVDPSNGAAYYFQPQTGESQWEPPLL